MQRERKDLSNNHPYNVHTSLYKWELSSGRFWISSFYISEVKDSETGFVAWDSAGGLLAFIKKKKSQQQQPKNQGEGQGNKTSQGVML